MKKCDIIKIQSDKKSDKESETDSSKEDGLVFWTFLEECNEFKHRGKWEKIKVAA